MIDLGIELGAMPPADVETIRRALAQYTPDARDPEEGERRAQVLAFVDLCLAQRERVRA